MTITKTDEETIFSFTDDEAECPANKEGDGHDWHASRPTIKDGPTEDGDWEVIFPMKCAACGRTGTSEAAASDGFIEYDKERLTSESR